ncbi:hypothetical protein MNBD_BACTEROID05-1259 [hydrothermal vent metagenome]|uniref:LSU ribosomal protein L21p n=1 Tax=hydrothermal vent metagenome TaxID=652676 RepID=A0A3B0TCC7_9ZZZZ
MYAVIQIGSSQFKVSEGDVIHSKRMKEEVGSDIVLDQVLLFAKDSDIRVGQPILKDVTVKAKVIDQFSGTKVTSLKYRRTKDSACKTGHREKLTALNIEKISAK